ncbi:MAG TPA: alpha-glucan family phosphorylase [Actinomycetota bacterium]|nr:alpha-glucan family phosphorylase [Actinomycetota bacterium]
MKAIRSFAVRASLPARLSVLSEVAMNLRWSWDRRATELFNWIDADAWETAEHNPVRMLGLTTSERLEALTQDKPFLSFLSSVEDELRTYLTEPRWFQNRATSPLKQVAYFSPEFGVSEALPIYSGGLGVLAGDHLKAASDLGIPLVGIGLLYRQGYFRQQLNADGWQQERYPALDPHGMPLTLVTDGDGQPLKIEVDMAGARCVAQLWRADVGRIPLLLLDCDVEENDLEERGITDRLYGGGTDHRLRQEIVLGIGGVRALRAAGYEPDVYHSNEGHAGFLGVERIRELVTTQGLSFDEALEAVRVATVFTTHTPVPAGIDVYKGDLIERYFDSFVKECDTDMGRFIALGQATPSADEDLADSLFNMAIMGLHLAGHANAVSKLHGVVSRAIFSDLWPDIPQDEVPITSVTNGVHASTWIGPEILELFDRRLARGWTETGDAAWDKITEVPDAELWRARERARERLVYFVRERLRRQLAARGASSSELTWTEDVFDPTLLTIGFARRFAQYKRGTLILSDLDRIRRLLLSGDRPIQLVMAGKAHPLDDGGKEMIQRLHHFAADPEIRSRFVFIEDYDMEVARVLCQGCDVWLNNPRRPLEACGTSGMKAAINGTLNCSILDGWWDECYDGSNGWAIGSVYEYADDAHQDRVEASALYDLLEREIVPRFYDRSEGPVPRRWLERMKSSISSLGHYVGADRMLRDYVEQLYEPAAASASAIAAESWTKARELKSWKERIRHEWEDVRIADVSGDVVAAELGEEREVYAVVRLGRLSTDDVTVQLAHGRVGANGELMSPTVVPMTADRCEEGTCSYRGTFMTEHPGLYGYAVRAIPSHPDLTNRMDLGLIAWG